MDKEILKMPSELEQAKEQIIKLQLENHNLRQTMRDEFNRYHHWQIENKKLEQENETLERTNNELRKRFSEDTTKLSAELMELKADIESRTMCITCERELQNCNLQTENEQLKEENEKLNKMTGIFSVRLCGKYRQALQEIRKMLKGHNVADEVRIKSILAKINEVIGAE